MGQSAVVLKVQTRNDKGNLNVYPNGGLYVLGTTGSWVFGSLMFPTPGQVFSAVPRLGLPVLARAGL